MDEKTRHRLALEDAGNESPANLEVAGAILERARRRAADGSAPRMADGAGSTGATMLRGTCDDSAADSDRGGDA